MTDLQGELLASLLGSAFGVGLALFVDRLNEARRSRAASGQRALDRDEREASALRIVQWLVEENLELLRQAVSAFESRGLFYFRMNTHLLDATQVELATLCDEPTLLWRVEHFRYQLHHLNEKLKALTDAETYQGVPTATAKQLLDKLLIPSIRKQIADVIVPLGDGLLPDLRSRVQRLSRIQHPPVRPPQAVPTVEMRPDSTE